MSIFGCQGRILSLIATAGLLGGCAGYRLGSTHDGMAGGKTVRVALFENETLEPRLTEAVATSLRRRIQQDGTLKLSTHGSADFVVQGRITDYKRTSLSFQPGDVLTPRDMELRLSAQVTVSPSGGSFLILDRVVSSRTTIRAENNLSAAERAAVPLLSEDLARTIVSLLVDGDW